MRQFWNKLLFTGFFISLFAVAEVTPPGVERTKTVSANYTVDKFDQNIYANSASGAITLTLPAASGLAGKNLRFYATSNSNTVTLSASSICGLSSIVLSGAGDEITVQSDGTNWVGVQKSCDRTIAAIYTTNAGNILVSGGSYVDFEDVVIDTHNAVTISTGTPKNRVTSNNNGWKFTAPATGIYDVSALVTLNNVSLTATTTFIIGYAVNGSIYVLEEHEVQATNTTYHTRSVTFPVSLIAGWYIEIYVYHNEGSDRQMYPGGSNSKVAIIKRK